MPLFYGNRKKKYLNHKRHKRPQKTFTKVIIILSFVPFVVQNKKFDFFAIAITPLLNQ
jgi:hypothetical protein